jgi:hypothetical protein
MAMTFAEFALAALRLAAILVPTLVAAHYLRRRFLLASGPIAVLVDAVLALSLLLVVAELVGVASLERFWVIATFVGDRGARGDRTHEAHAPGSATEPRAATV